MDIETTCYRLGLVVDRLESIRDNEFDYNVWVMEPVNGCGTVGCALGHACFIPELQELGLYLNHNMPTVRRSGNIKYSAAKEIFGISLNAAYELFSPIHSSVGANATRKQVANHIRNYIAKLQNTSKGK